MSAEQNEQGLPAQPSLKLVVRDEKPISDRPLIDPALWQMGYHCPQIELPLQALRKNRENNPAFAQGKERQLLAYALWTDYPHAVPHIAKVFGTTEKQIKNWIGYVEDHMVDSWDEFDEIQEQLREEGAEKDTNQFSFYQISPLWNPEKTTPEKLVKSLGPRLRKIVSVAQPEISYQEVSQQTGLTYGSTKQRLYIARKKIEKRNPELQNYTKLNPNDHELLLAVRFGKLDGFHIGKIWYANNADIDNYKSRIIIPESKDTTDDLRGQKPQRKQSDTSNKYRYYPNGKTLNDARAELGKRKK